VDAARPLETSSIWSDALGAWGRGGAGVLRGGAGAGADNHGRWPREARRGWPAGGPRPGERDAARRPLATRSAGGVVTWAVLGRLLVGVAGGTIGAVAPSEDRTANFSYKSQISGVLVSPRSVRWTRPSVRSGRRLIGSAAAGVWTSEPDKLRGPPCQVTYMRLTVVQRGHSRRRWLRERRWTAPELGSASDLWGVRSVRAAKTRNRWSPVRGPGTTSITPEHTASRVRSVHGYAIPRGTVRPSDRGGPQPTPGPTTRGCRAATADT
jgi:hypothetical protein